jgi:hypothetical protein
MVDVADHIIIEIDWCSYCQAACSHCTRAVADRTAKTHFELDPKEFEKALKSLEGWQGKGGINTVGAIGGNPILHKKFELMCDIFRANWGPSGRLRQFRGPILDIAQAFMGTQCNHSSKRVLFTNLGKQFYPVYEAAVDTFSWIQVNTHEHAGEHRAMFMERSEYNKLTGQSDDDWVRNRDSCGLQRDWSPAIMPDAKGEVKAWFCEVAATIDTLFFEGKSGWSAEKGWWKRTAAEYGDQIHLCNYCALAQPSPTKLDREEMSIVTQTTLGLLQRAESPQIRKGRFEMFDPTNNPAHGQGKAWDTEFYVEDREQQAYLRLPLSNRDLYPRSLSAVIVCVGYARQLAITLPHNLPLVDQMVIVTTSDDLATQEVVKSWECSKLKLIISDRCYDNDASFNKGSLLNDAMAAIDRPDWIVSTDADCFLNERLPSMMQDAVLNPGVLYFTDRADLREQDIPRWKAGTFFRKAPPSGITPAASGYFQLFNRRALAIRDKWPNVNSEAFCSAGGVDTYFLHQWISEDENGKFDFGKVIYLPEIPIQHIEHSKTYGQNWNGFRPIREGQWVQLGMVSRNPQVLAMFHDEVPRYGFVKKVAMNCFQQFRSLQFAPYAGLQCRAIRMRTGESIDFEMLGDEIGPFMPPRVIDILAPEMDKNHPTILWRGVDVKEEFIQIEARLPAPPTPDPLAGPVNGVANHAPNLEPAPVSG